MGVLDAILLGIVQGLTEFLPVSSDGHLALAEWARGVPASLPLGVLLHAGTLAVVLVGFRREVAVMFRGALDLARRRTSEPDARFFLLVLAASVPTAIIGLLLRDVSAEWTEQPRIVALWLAVTAVLLLSTARQAGDRTLTMRDAVLIGVAQGLAVLPGLSRSGSTIALALLLGVRREDAARFSFAASIPAVAGALVLELPKLDWTTVSLAAATVGVLAAAISGAFALRIVLRFVRAGRLWWFGPYLLVLVAVVAAVA